MAATEGRQDNSRAWITPGSRLPFQPVALDSGGILKLLLTSGGVTNTSIRRALVDLLGKPTADATALCIPTAQWGHPRCGPVSARIRQRHAPVGWLDLDEVVGTPLNSRRCQRSARSG